LCPICLYRGAVVNHHMLETPSRRQGPRRRTTEAPRLRHYRSALDTASEGATVAYVDV